MKNDNKLILIELMQIPDEDFVALMLSRYMLEASAPDQAAEERLWGRLVGSMTNL